MSYFKERKMSRQQVFAEEERLKFEQELEDEAQAGLEEIVKPRRRRTQRRTQRTRPRKQHRQDVLDSAQNSQRSKNLFDNIRPLPLYSGETDDNDVEAVAASRAIFYDHLNRYN